MLLWQGRIRIAVALFAGGAAFALEQTGILRGDGATLIQIIAGYIAIIGLLDWLIRRTERAGNLVVTATVLSDLEVEHKEVVGQLTYFRYPIVDEQGQLTGEYIPVAQADTDTYKGAEDMSFPHRLQELRILSGFHCDLREKDHVARKFC